MATRSRLANHDAVHSRNTAECACGPVSHLVHLARCLMMTSASHLPQAIETAAGELAADVEFDAEDAVAAAFACLAMAPRLQTVHLSCDGPHLARNANFGPLMLDTRTVALLQPCSNITSLRIEVGVRQPCGM